MYKSFNFNIGCTVELQSELIGPHSLIKYSDIGVFTKNREIKQKKNSVRNNYNNVDFNY